MTDLRIATRRSALAWRQAELVAAALQTRDPALTVELVGMQTAGDRILDRSLAAIGGKGLFIKELEQGLLDGRADIAVHSMKDVPGECAPGLHLPVILERESPFDAFVSNRFAHPDELPEGAVIGSCSLRRASQLLHHYPYCRIEELRGNVNTRLAKLDAGRFDAIVLAVAGLERLGLGERITARLEPAICLPAIGQGALGIECREGDAEIEGRIAELQAPVTSACVIAERAVSRQLGGSCLSPIAGFAWPEGEGLMLRARVGSTDGRRLLAAGERGGLDEAAALGMRVAAELLDLGAAEVLNAGGDAA